MEPEAGSSPPQRRLWFVLPVVCVLECLLLKAAQSESYWTSPFLPFCSCLHFVSPPSAVTSPDLIPEWVTAKNNNTRYRPYLDMQKCAAQTHRGDKRGTGEEMQRVSKSESLWCWVLACRLLPVQRRLWPRRKEKWHLEKTPRDLWQAQIRSGDTVAAPRPRQRSDHPSLSRQRSQFQHELSSLNRMASSGQISSKRGQFDEWPFISAWENDFSGIIFVQIWRKWASQSDKRSVWELEFNSVSNVLSPSR